MSKIGSAIERAVKVNALRQLAREIGIAEAVGVLATMDDRPPRERAATARQSRRAAMLAEYERLTKLGHGRNAVTMVAHKFAAKDDAVELQNLARNLRRWRRRNSDSVRLARAESIRG